MVLSLQATLQRDALRQRQLSATQALLQQCDAITSLLKIQLELEFELLLLLESQLFTYIAAGRARLARTGRR